MSGDRLVRIFELSYRLNEIVGETAIEAFSGNRKKRSRRIEVPVASFNDLIRLQQ